MKLLISILLILTSSCKIKKDEKAELNSVPLSHNCQELVDYLKNSWRKSAEGYFYFKQEPTDYNKSYTPMFMAKCLNGMHKMEIKKIFGEPSAQFKYSHYYYVNSDCAEGAPPLNFSYKCVFLTITFDDSDHVVGFSGKKRFVAPKQ